MNSACSNSGIWDHCSFDSFPRLIAAFHALHRLLVPRHPPHALMYLATLIHNLSCKSASTLTIRQTPSRHTRVQRSGNRPLRKRFQMPLRLFQIVKDHSSFRRLAALEDFIILFRCLQPCGFFFSDSPKVVYFRTCLASSSRARFRERGTVTSFVVLVNSRIFFFSEDSDPQWRRSGSNRQPPPCKGGALPVELRPPKL